MITLPHLSEQWLPIPGYEELYEVSNCGQIRVKQKRRNWIAGRIMIGGHDRLDYQFVKLTSANGICKTHMKHRLVLLAFVGECPAGYEVNHKNGIKADNRLENLEYMTHQENIQHSYSTLKRSAAKGEDTGRAVLKESDIPVILQMIQGGKSQREIGKLYGVSHVAIGAVSRGMTWTHLERGDFEAPKYEGSRRINAKLSDADVREIRQLASDGMKQCRIAERFQVTQAMISNVVKGKTWKHVKLGK